VFHLDYSNIYTNLLCNSSREGKDAKSVATQLGWGDEGGLYAMTDDRNLAWEDIDYESDNEYEFEMRWRQDERANNDPMPEALSKEELTSSGINAKKAFNQVSNKITINITIC
jgi:hypothetical protein